MKIVIAIYTPQIHIGYSKDSHNIDGIANIHTPRLQRAVASMCIELIESLVGKQPISEIVVLCSGQLNTQRGTIISMPYMQWHALRIVLPLKKHFATQVTLQHAVSAEALATTWHHKIDHQLQYYLHWGSALEGALLQGQSIIVPYTPVGYMNWDDQSNVNDYLSSHILTSMYQADIENLSKQAWQLTAQVMAQTIYQLYCATGIEHFIVGGPVSQYKSKFQGQLNKHLRQVSTKPLSISYRPLKNTEVMLTALQSM